MAEKLNCSKESTPTTVVEEVDSPSQDFRDPLNMVRSHFRRSIGGTYRGYATGLARSPLEGIKVLDLTRFVAGPICTMILGDLGADVYKIEEVGKGDIMRNVPPFVKGSDLSCQFASVNRNKKSVCVNIKSTEGQEIVKNIAKQCDVLVENYVPGNLEKYGLDYENLRPVSPKLIYCSITGFGQKGPYRSKPGVDLIAASLGGFLHITGPEDGEPCKAGVAVTDMMTGLYAHGAIMAALINRSHTGEGEKIDCDLFSTQVAGLTNLGSNYLNAGQEAKRLGTAHVGLVPYETFKTKDGYLSVGTMNDDQFGELCSKMSLSHLISDVRFITMRDRVRNKLQLLPFLKSVFILKTTSDWCKIFETCSFPYGAMNTLQQVFSDPQTEAIDIVKEVYSSSGPIKLIGPPVEFRNSTNTIRLPPPALGQHTAEVLRDLLHYSTDRIDKLRSADIIR